MAKAASDRVVRLIDSSEYKRRQAPSAPRSPAAPSARTQAADHPPLLGGTPLPRAAAAVMVRPSEAAGKSPVTRLVGLRRDREDQTRQ
jgi:hypothetical protein